MDAAYYQFLIGILRWIVELRRVNICTEVSLLSSCLDLPRAGNQEQVFHVFAYLKKHHNTEMLFDLYYPEIDQNQFERQDRSHTVYGDSLTSGLPPNMLEPGGLEFLLSTYVDSYHAGNTITCCSQTGFLVYCNSALIYWISKKKIPMKNHLLVVSFVQ